jgi:hypothetical protein
MCWRGDTLGRQNQLSRRKMVRAGFRCGRALLRRAPRRAPKTINMSSENRRKAVRWIAGSVLLVIASLLLLEAAGRVYMHFRYGVPGKTYGRWRADAELGARMAENVYDHRWQTNDRGFRNDEDVIEPRQKDCLRVIAYGGSTTLCWNLPTPQTWPAQLEERLREVSGRPCHQVLNAGDILWSLSHVLARAKTEIPELRPDVVLIYSGINEVGNALYLAHEGMAMDELVASGNYGVFSRRLPQNRWLVRNSFAFKLLHKVLVTPLEDVFRNEEGRRWSRLLATWIDAEHPAMPPDPGILENYLHVLDTLIDLCRSHGAEPIFIVQAHGANTVGFDNLTAYSREGGRVARRLGVRVVKAQAIVDSYHGDPMDLFIETGVHWSARGASLFADYIYEAAFQADVLPPSH